MDSLSSLFSRFSLNARVFYTGNLCSIVDFDEQPGLGHLHVMREGHLQVQRPGKATLDISEPSLLFYPRPHQHRFHADAPGGATLVCATIDFGAGMGNPLLQALPDFLLIPLASIEGIDATLALLFQEAFTDLKGRQTAINLLTEYFLVLMLRHVIHANLVKAGVLAALADPRLTKAIAAMHEHPEQEWSLESLGRTAGMSRARFAAHFHQTIGATPLNYLTDWRISLAQAMLKKGKAVKFIAPLVGYSSPVALTRVFTRRVGMSPSQWLAG
ncbi:AraC family transcriptional regulator [Herbaspirillum sp. RTI4]|uniref:AraC family transcriptional regulator n=1 Tax=Herbaspirillum sp. RTI4 TaxID=3048640 RepID=UPI002AB591CE|nr:AraC family transcriptional regulator [Herbaspirillum sp. RTI4]MDY7577895.1 AraC family transcriptional regulator [Herbaspirillum sp. RTI4]MEA9981659.1 AraC family transcriptional regulator [Herbaspirillum sp. RTI4]